jgi:hypothetical protein
VDAITRLTQDTVTIDRTQEHVAAGPRYDPELVRDTDGGYGDVYAHYGVLPFWGMGYRYPAYPYYGTI